MNHAAVSLLCVGPGANPIHDCRATQDPMFVPNPLQNHTQRSGTILCVSTTLLHTTT